MKNNTTRQSNVKSRQTPAATGKKEKSPAGTPQKVEVFPDVNTLTPMTPEDKKRKARQL